jgi:hypothetical protein
MESLNRRHSVNPLYCCYYQIYLIQGSQSKRRRRWLSKWFSNGWFDHPQVGEVSPSTYFHLVVEAKESVMMTGIFLCSLALLAELLKVANGLARAFWEMLTPSPADARSNTL